ncbi:MAG: TetR/AcrR family transcriptional regulator [Actinomycetota bacterium]|nr:TetR/AcrR family transcriptional regulator [Actinomycetota bacterium]
MRVGSDTTVQTKGAQTRRAILDAAIVRYGRDGYRSTSVADIARDASVGGTVAYAYFPNKEALFLAAVDEDAAGVIHEGLSSAVTAVNIGDWRQTLLVTLIGALERHPLARRLLAGLEPEVTDRVLEIPALDELRRTCAERLRREQVNGSVRADIDPVTIANGIVAIMLSLLMSVVQLGGAAAASYGNDVAAVLQAAIEQTPPSRGEEGHRP